MRGSASPNTSNLAHESVATAVAKIHHTHTYNNLLQQQSFHRPWQTPYKRQQHRLLAPTLLTPCPLHNAARHCASQIILTFPSAAIKLQETLGLGLLYYPHAQRKKIRTESSNANAQHTSKSCLADNQQHFEWVVVFPQCWHKVSQ